MLGILSVVRNNARCAKQPHCANCDGIGGVIKMNKPAACAKWAMFLLTLWAVLPLQAQAV
ncbi:MAG: hypothetical protein GDYSWBUE_002009, partial [Candidatus Fervidibacterota bacterium]